MIRILKINVFLMFISNQHAVIDIFSKQQQQQQQQQKKTVKFIVVFKLEK